MLPLITGVIIVFFAGICLLRFRDITHPAVFMAPFFIFFYSVWPLILNVRGDLDFLFENLAFPQTCFLLTLTVFFGCMILGRPLAQSEQTGDLFWSFQSLGPSGQRKLFWFAMFLGALSLIGYMKLVGGFSGLLRTYSTAKGTTVGSGILGESILLSFPSLVLLALYARLKGKLTVWIILLALLIMSPHIILGTLGGRRGPLFISVVALFLSYYIATNQRPKFTHMAVLSLTLPLAMIFLVANRSNIYIGSDFEMDFESALEFILPPPEEIARNDYVFAVAQVLKADYYGDYYYGWRYFVTFFIRPIPRLIWPTKWDDIDAPWLTDLDKNTGVFLEVVGFNALAGSSGGSIADGYQEFSWGVVIMFAVLARLFAVVWYKHRNIGGKWTVVLTIMLALSIYLPTQSFGAWGFRAMLAAVPMLVIWTLLFRPGQRPAAIGGPVAYPPLTAR